METIVRVSYDGGRKDFSDGGDPSDGKKCIRRDARGVTSIATVDQIGAAALAELAGPRESVNLGAADMPWVQPADTLTVPARSGTTVQTVAERRVSIDRNGYGHQTVTVGDRADAVEARSVLAIKRLSGGLASGRSAGASPTVTLDPGVASGPMSAPTPMRWTCSPLKVSDGPADPWPEDPVVVMKVTCELTQSVADDVTVECRMNGSEELTIVIPSGSTNYSVLNGAWLIPTKAPVQIAVTDIGTLDEETLREDEVQLVVQLIYAPASLQTPSK